MIIIFLVTVIVFDFLLRKTTVFRKVFYTGSNERAAAYSGIRTKKVVFLTTTLCSALCGFAGIIYMARFGSAQPTFGIGMELNVIAAAVIGGASLNGGTGTIFGAILGVVLLSVVSSSLALWMCRSIGRTSSAAQFCWQQCPLIIFCTNVGGKS